MISRKIVDRIQDRQKEIALDRALKFVEIVYNESQATVPVRTGRLKRSWFQKISDYSDNKIGIRYGYSAYYATAVDKGTPVFPGRLYFTNAQNKAAEWLKSQG